jgi:hypothetical protein
VIRSLPYPFFNPVSPTSPDLAGTIPRVSYVQNSRSLFFGICENSSGSSISGAVQSCSLSRITCNQSDATSFSFQKLVGSKIMQSHPKGTDQTRNKNILKIQDRVMRLSPAKELRKMPSDKNEKFRRSSDGLPKVCNMKQFS